jgi:hypothetical protein
MVESKIGSGEGQDQLRRYSEHLEGMAGFDGKTLLYVTRGYDRKDPKEIFVSLSGDVRFKQLRWHDFYRLLHSVPSRTNEPVIPRGLVRVVGSFCRNPSLRSS